MVSDEQEDPLEKRPLLLQISEISAYSSIIFHIFLEKTISFVCRCVYACHKTYFVIV